MNLSEKSLALVLLLMSAFATASGRLGSVMKEMRKDYKAIQSQVAAGQIDGALPAAAARFKRSAQEARGLVPPKINSLRDPQERARALKGYQSMIDQLVAEIDLLQKALGKRDLQAAATSLQKIKEWQDRGHERFD